MNYVVSQEAVYRHDTYGPCASLASASALADKIADADKDSHHIYVVRTIDANGMGDDRPYETWKDREPCSECGGEMDYTSRKIGKCMECRRAQKQA